MDRKYLRPRQMAEELELTEPTLRKLMAMVLPYMQVRRAVWLDREKVFDWLATFEKRKNSPKKQELTGGLSMRVLDTGPPGSAGGPSTPGKTSKGWSHLSDFQTKKQYAPENVHTNRAEADPCWQQFFPFKDCRPIQAEALDFIVEHFPRYNDILIEAPCGVGKSALAIALAHWRAAHGQSTYISVTSIELENQYIRDFHRLGLRQLHSKSRYLCESFGSCDLGLTSIKNANGKRRKRCQEDFCSYQFAKNAFTTASLSVSNASFLLTSAKFIPNWTTRELGIFDETHQLADKICDAFQIKIALREVPQHPPQGGEIDWLRSYYAHWLAVQICELDEQLQDADEDDPDLDRIVRKLDEAGRKLQNLGKLFVEDPRDWGFDHQPNYLIISPIWAIKTAQALLPKIARKRIYLSATLPGPELQMRYLGIDPKRAVFLSLDSPFPVKNRLIHFVPKVDWKHPDPAIALCEIVERILRKHTSSRGIIFTSSYAQAHLSAASRIVGLSLTGTRTIKSRPSNIAQQLRMPSSLVQHHTRGSICTMT